MAKYGAPIAGRLNFHFLFHPEVIEHCASKGYISLKDLGDYKARIPTERCGSMCAWSEQKFQAEMARLTTAINSSMCSLERPESKDKVNSKKSRIEKKDE